jgi:hypothetical protein
MRFKATHIQQGKALVRTMDANDWELGDLLLEVFPRDQWGQGALSHWPRKDGRFIEHGEKFLSALEEFAKRIGYDKTTITLVNHRHTSLCWPPTHRVKGVSWTAHRVLNSQPSRFKILKPGMKARDAQAAAGLKWTDYKAKGAEISRYSEAIEYLKTAASFMRSASSRIGHLSLSDRQILEIGGLVGRLADRLDTVIEAAGLDLDEKAS